MSNKENQSEKDSTKQEKQIDQILDHNYDGIQEYDNDLPGWWVMMFWGCIVIGILYVLYFHVFSGQFTSQKLDQEMEQVLALQQKSEKKVESEISEEVLLAFANQPDNVAKGNDLYQAKCMPCHAADGGGMIGPNFTDDYWIHGGSLMDIREVVLEGVPDKGMIAWKTLMTPQEIKEVLAYLHSLRGTTAANPKEAQGEEYFYPAS